MEPRPDPQQPDTTRVNLRDLLQEWRRMESERTSQDSSALRSLVTEFGGQMVPPPSQEQRDSARRLRSAQGAPDDLGIDLDADDDGFIRSVASAIYGLRQGVGGTIASGGQGIARGTLQLSQSLHSMASIAEDRMGLSDSPGMGQLGQRSLFLRYLADQIGQSEGAVRASGQLEERRQQRDPNRSGPFSSIAESIGMNPSVGRALDDIGRDIADLAKMDPADAAAYMADMAGSNAPQLAPVVAASMVAGPAAGAAVRAGMATATGAALSASSLLDEARYDSEGKPIPVSNKAVAYSLAAGGVAGAFDAMGALGALKFGNRVAQAMPFDDAIKATMGKEIAKGMASAAGGAGTESLTEVVQTVIENTGAKLGFDPDRVLTEGISEAFLAGLMLGGGTTVAEATSKGQSNLIQNRIARASMDAAEGMVAQNEALLSGDLDQMSEEGLPDNTYVANEEAANALPQPALPEEEVESQRAYATKMTTEELQEILDNEVDYDDTTVFVASEELSRRADTQMSVKQAEKGQPASDPVAPVEPAQEPDPVAFHSDQSEVAAELSRMDNAGVEQIINGDDYEASTYAAAAIEARARGLDDAAIQAEVKIEKLNRGKPLPMERINKMNKTQMVKEAKKRGVKLPTDLPPRHLARILYQGTLPTTDTSHATSHEEVLDIVARESNSKFELIEHMVYAESSPNPEMDSPQYALAEFLADPNVRLWAEDWQSRHGLFADDGDMRRRFYRGERTANQRLAPGEKRGARVLSVDDTMAELREAYPQYEWTEDQVVDYLEGRPSPAEDVKRMSQSPGLDALRERFKEVTGRSKPPTRSEMDAVMRELESEAAQTNVVREQSVGMARNLLEVAAETAGVDISNPSGIDNDGLLRIYDALDNAMEPYGQRGTSMINEFTNEEIWTIAESIRGIVLQRTENAPGSEPAPLRGRPRPDDGTQEQGQPDEGGAEDTGSDDPFSDDFVALQGLDAAKMARFLYEKVTTPSQRKKIRRQSQRWFLPEGDLDKSLFNRIRKADSQHEATVKRAELLLRDLAIRHKSATGHENLTKLEQKAYLAYLQGKNPGTIIPKDVKETLDGMRDLVDQTSRRLIEEGVVDGEMAAIIEQNMGVYFTRTFRLHSDPNWEQTLRDMEAAGNDVAVRIMQNARAGITDRLMHRRARAKANAQWKAATGKSVMASTVKDPLWQTMYANAYANTKVNKGDINAEIAKYLDTTSEGYLAKASTMRKNMGVLRKKRNFDPWELALMGEHTDPRQNFIATVARANKLLETHIMLADIRDTFSNRATGSLDAMFIHPDDFDQVDSDTVYEKISTDTDPKLSPLSGYYVDKDVLQALREFGGDVAKNRPWWENYYLRALGMTKAGKVVYSIQTQVRNHVSASLFALSQGYVPNPKDYASAFSAALQFNLRQGRSMDPDTQAEMLRLLELGVLNESTPANDLRGLFKDAGMESAVANTFFGDGAFIDDPSAIQKMTNASARTLHKWLIKKPEQAYMFGDNVWKVYIFRKELADLKKIYPDRTVADLEQEAAEIVRNQTPTYSLVSPNVQALRRFPLAGPFVSFHYEALRTFWNTLERGSHEIISGSKNSNPRLVVRGMRRLGFAALSLRAPAAVWGAIAPAVGSMLGQAFGDDDRDKAALRVLAPPFYQNTDIIPMARNGGDIVYQNVGFLNPWNAFSDPAMMMYRATQGNTWTEEEKRSLMWGMAKEMLEPYVSSEILTEAMVQAYSGVDQYGDPIFNPDDSAPEKLTRSLEHIMNSVKPGVWNQVEKMLDPNRDLGTEAFATFSGHRITTLNLDKSVSYAASRLTNRKRQISTDVRNDLRKPGLTDERAREILDKADEELAKAYGRAYKVSSAAAWLLREPDLYNVLDGKITGRDDADALSYGEYIPYSNAKVLDTSIERATNPRTRQILENNKEVLRRVMGERDTREQPLPSKWKSRAPSPDDWEDYWEERGIEIQRPQ